MPQTCTRKCVSVWQLLNCGLFHSNCFSNFAVDGQGDAIWGMFGIIGRYGQKCIRWNVVVLGQRDLFDHR